MNDMIGKRVLNFSGTSDNKPSVALGVDKYAKYSGPVQCMCNYSALVVNNWISPRNVLSNVLEIVYDVSF